MLLGEPMEFLDLFNHHHLEEATGTIPMYLMRHVVEKACTETHLKTQIIDMGSIKSHLIKPVMDIA